MLGRVLRSLRGRAGAGLRAARRCPARWTRPSMSRSLVLGATADLVRGRSALIAENALLRQQLIVLSARRSGPASPGPIEPCWCC